ncbi:unnamed protein product [Lactuca saligna]|uniref:Phorbol-ester/DAG-type domain-containing protein n=1 Tax=Lactuca saligna TaxID=75948 RepID=A0AA35ZSV2_LACSI|nr:unnamed protein product [Lactuca saligna]
MEQLEHFSHNHPLNLVQLQPNHNEEEDVDDFVVEDHHVGQCNMCEEDIYSFHLRYYTCKNCNYSLHNFCAEIHKTLQDHPLHNPNHNLTLSKGFQDLDLYFSLDKEWTCGLCNHKQKNLFNYHCSICKFNMDIICATMCDRCRHYVHIHCATSKYGQFLRAGCGKICKNFKDDDHPNLLCCRFPNESYNLLKHHFINNEKDFVVIDENHGEPLKHLTHNHQLVLVDKQTSLNKNSILLHIPLKKIQLLCDGCVKPITEIPFYKCLKDVRLDCGFVLHEWCARLPPKIEDHPGHLNHTLFLMPNITTEMFHVFGCKICMLPSNGFSYGCRTCEYYVIVNCAFLPKEITHEAHPDHLLSRIDTSSSLSDTPRDACGNYLINCIAFFCPSCDLYLDTQCAFMLPGLIRHKYDKHPLTLRYNPVENHPGDYFFEICEEEFNPESWFYHCGTCVQSMHTACAPLIIQSEQAVYTHYKRSIFYFANVKFRGTFRLIQHRHLLTFTQGIKSHGNCYYCREKLQYRMIFNCLKCMYTVHNECHQPVNVLRVLVFLHLAW